MLRAALLFGASIMTLPACALNLPEDMESYRREQGGASAQQVLSGSAGALACAPRSDYVLPPMTPWKPVRPLHQNACDEATLRTITNCLLLESNRGAPTCVQFMNDPRNQACLSCARTSATDPQQGPLVDDTYGIRENLPACVSAVAGDTSANGCGPRIDAYNTCMGNACGHCTEQDFDACAQAADVGQCANAGKASECGNAFVAKCGAGALTEMEFAVQLVKTFCMP